MTALSPRLGLTIPNADGSDPANLAALLRSLGLDVENKAPGVTAMTNAARVALTGDAKFSGRVVWCTDTSTLHVCDGTNWWPIARLTSDGRLAAGVSELDAGMFSATAPVMDGSAAVGSSLKPARSDHRHPADTSRLPLAGGTMSGDVAMGGNKVTGLGAATANGDAVRFEQALLRAGGTMTGPIAMGGSKITGLAAGSGNGDAVRWEQIQPVYAIGVLTSDQTIAASGTNVTVALADGSDPYGINSSGVFTLPSAGVWQVSGVAEFDVGFSFNNTIALVHNSTRIAASKPWYTKVSPAQGTPWAAWSILINAAASDTVKMVADNSNGISGIPLLATVTRMSVVKIGS